MARIPIATPAPAPAAPAHDIQHYLRAGTLQLSSLPPLSLYLHLPWCLRKCPYCDFNSHAWHAGSAGDLPEQRYTDALFADLEAALPLVWGRMVHSVFIGGGTPSLFSPRSIDRLIGGVRARLLLAPDCEITLEANPGTFEKERFRAFRTAGVTRLSVGVQSFNDRHLQALGRVHDGAQALAAVQEAAQAFDCFNLDLMYALPGQTPQELEQDVQTALALDPPHLSVYHLSIEPNTWFAKHPPALPGDDQAYAMLDRITEMTGHAGLARYEVSAYARAGQQCSHNTNYWRFGDYLGIGAGAHSKLSFAHRVLRQVRLREPRRYMDGALAGRALAQEHDVRRADLPFEFMLNALRLREGFALQDFSARTGLPPSCLAKGLEAAERRGLIERDILRVRPTQRGFDFLNDLQALFLPD
ncbi:radical SAM family heme chaperone HemW [Verminephrobacter aporrectodeae]|uniref:radical SAM family heme chaperone HemW n=1 Tax=Verminephrobacter aporrectodeae TaxID=1110389 RepID=UPI0022430351|nr:radical SAM family heme chaperone HemW [Verminephrobacter aporrectodeae]MCW8176544.1 oxygen-independent coproporphyrinogen III oxidase-like protein [Verminephrobacter aporrectodeae subsp. tuberculatae]MCW8204197.1 oxygen-independent coproporphyrinogen III oxidase-like protein [Verminephrobacter aporrectodeae subsp. tuberculatae]